MGNTHLADKAVLIDGPPLLAVGQPRGLGPHLLHVLEDHVAVAVEGLDAGQELAVVPDGDQDLGVAAHRGLQDGQRAGAELVFLEKRNFVFPVPLPYASRLVFFDFRGRLKWMINRLVGGHETFSVHLEQEGSCVRVWEVGYGGAYVNSLRGLVRSSLEKKKKVMNVSNSRHKHKEVGRKVR